MTAAELAIEAGRQAVRDRIASLVPGPFVGVVEELLTDGIKAAVSAMRPTTLELSQGEHAAAVLEFTRRGQVGQ